MKKRKINEEEYSQKITLYAASNPFEAEKVLDYARKSYGLSRYDSGVDGNLKVYAYIEKDPNNDSYFYEMRKELANFGKRLAHASQRNVSERMVLKKNVLREAENVNPSGGFDPNDPYNQVKLVHDPKVRHGKEWADNGGNFPVERNGNVYYVSRSIAVSLATFCRDKYGGWCVLANQRGPGVNKDAGLWNLPAGFLDYGESTEGAAIRETFEETGVDVSGAKLRLLGTNSSRFGGSQNVNMAYVCVLDGVVDDYPVSDQNSEPGEVSDIKWIPILDKDGNQTGIIEKFQWNKRPKEIYSRAYAALAPYINGKKKYSDITKYLRDEISGNDNVKYYLSRIADEMKKNVANPKAILYMIDMLKSAASA